MHVLRKSRKISTVRIKSAAARFVSPVALGFLGLHGRIRPTVRARVVVLHGKNVLLVQDWVHPKRWELPGGAKRRSETAKEAAIRELAEETGIVVAANRMSYLQTYYGKYEAPIYRVNASANDISVQTKEIINAAWWPIDKLPDNISPIVRIALQNLPKSS